LIPVGFGYGDEDEIFLRGWVWDRETHARPAPLSSLVLYCVYINITSTIQMDRIAPQYSSILSFSSILSLWDSFILWSMLTGS